MGPLKVAHLNGLSVSRQPMNEAAKDEDESASNDERVGRSRAFGSFFLCDLRLNGFVKQKMNV